MTKRMKIAIPTDDGVIMKPVICRSRGFVVVTIEDGNIIQQELRWNLLSEIMTSHDGIYYNLHDCDRVLTNGLGVSSVELIKGKSIEIKHTDEPTINEAILNELIILPVLIVEKQIA